MEANIAEKKVRREAPLRFACRKLGCHGFCYRLIGVYDFMEE